MDDMSKYKPSVPPPMILPISDPISTFHNTHCLNTKFQENSLSETFTILTQLIPHNDVAVLPDKVKRPFAGNIYNS